MTIETQTPRVVIIGNGTLGPYSLVDSSAQAIRFLSTAHVKLTRYASTTAETGTVLILNTDYTVGGTQDARTFTLIGSQAVLTSSQRIVAERSQTYVQDLDLTTGGAFSATAVEARHDKITEYLQEVKAILARKLEASPLDSTPSTMPLKANATAGDVLVYDADKNLIPAALSELDISATALGSGWQTILQLPAAGTLDNLAGVRFVATYAALTALTTATGLSDNSIYCTYGHSAEEDGGFGFWRYDSGSSATANGGTILAIDGGGAGRFFRLYDGKTADIRWFGAKCDAATDDSAAWALVSTWVEDGGKAIFVPGVTLTSTIDLNACENVVVFGPAGLNIDQETDERGGAEIRLTASGSGRLIDARDGRGIVFKDITITYSSSTFSGAVLDFSCASSVWCMHVLENVNFFQRGSSTYTADRLVDGYNAVDVAYRNVRFAHCQYGVSGATNTGSQLISHSSAIHRFYSCTWVFCEAGHIRNPGLNWAIIGSSVEPTSNGSPSPVVTSTIGDDFKIEGLAYHGSTFSDPYRKGTWMSIPSNIYSMSFSGHTAAGDIFLESAYLGIGATTTAVAHDEFFYSISGTTYYKAANPTGVAPGNDVIPQGKYGAVAFDIDSAGTVSVVEATDNATGYNSAALAAAGLPAAGGSVQRMGYVTAMKSDGAFTFGTTALNAANTTVAYTNSSGCEAPISMMRIGGTGGSATGIGMNGVLWSHLSYGIVLSSDYSDKSVTVSIGGLAILGTAGTSADRLVVNPAKLAPTSGADGVPILMQPIFPTSVVGNTTRALDTSGGSTTITGLGFRPSRVDIYVAVEDEPWASIGTATTTNTGQCISNNYTGDWEGLTTGAVYILDTVSSSTRGTVTMSNDGFVITWSTTGTPTSATMKIQYIAHK